MRRFLWHFLDLCRPDYWCKKRNLFVVVVGTIGAIGAALTLAFLLKHLWCSPAGTKIPEWTRTAFVLWTTLPPIWMWAEYWLMWRHDKCSEQTGALEKFKYGQDVGVKVWLAFATLLGALLFKG